MQTNIIYQLINYIRETLQQLIYLMHKIGTNKSSPAVIMKVKQQKQVLLTTFEK